MKTYQYILKRRLIEDGAEVKAINSQDAASFLLNNCFDPEEMFRENCWLLFLDSGSRITGSFHLSMGGIDSTGADIRIACSAALKALASGVILSHNHPSGNPIPSAKDIEETSRLKKALKVCDISLIDHIIIGDGEYYSFCEEKVIPMKKEA